MHQNAQDQHSTCHLDGAQTRSQALNPPPETSKLNHSKADTSIPWTVKHLEDEKYQSPSLTQNIFLPKHRIKYLTHAGNLSSFPSQTPFLAYPPQPPGVHQSKIIAQIACKLLDVESKGLLFIPGLSSYTRNVCRNIRSYSLLVPLPPLPAHLCHAPAQGTDLSGMHHPHAWAFGTQWVPQ